ncbi:hypothetical protein TWF481_007080 [Arthrobotrys musiformis]|uniref:Uncharacterized protein n=1 Tax=Arthrobotrys musiformis TaxID=47236 RepID=A0AAV9WAE0_9PEZI
MSWGQPHLPSPHTQRGVGSLVVFENAYFAAKSYTDSQSMSSPDLHRLTMERDMEVTNRFPPTRRVMYNPYEQTRMLQVRNIDLGIEELIFAAHKKFREKTICPNSGKPFPLESPGPQYADDLMNVMTPARVVSFSDGLLTIDDFFTLFCAERTLDIDGHNALGYSEWQHLAMLLMLPEFYASRQKYCNIFRWVVGEAVESVARRASRFYFLPYSLPKHQSLAAVSPVPSFVDIGIDQMLMNMVDLGYAPGHSSTFVRAPSPSESSASNYSL